VVAIAPQPFTQYRLRRCGCPERRTAQAAPLCEADRRGQLAL